MNSVHPSPRTALTPREREILEFILAGSSNKLTAYELGISQRTVEVHRSRIFQKMGVRNAVELVALMYRQSVSEPASSHPSASDAARPTLLNDPASRVAHAYSHTPRCTTCGAPLSGRPSNSSLQSGEPRT